MTLGIPINVGIPYEDVLKEALGGDSAAAPAFAAEVKVTSLVNEVDALLGGLPGAPSQQALSSIVFNVLATSVDAANGALNLSDPGTVDGIIMASAGVAGLSLDPDVASQAALVIAGVNAAIDSMPVSATSSYLTNVVQAQVVAEKVIAPQLTAVAAGTASIATVVANDTGAALSAEIAAATIGQLDLSGPTVSISSTIAQPAVYDGGTTFQFPVYLTTTSPITSPVTVDYTTEDLTATAASGAYTPVSGTLTWLPGDTSPQYISVPVNGDSIQPGLRFGLLLSNPTNATLGNDVAAGVIEYTGYATTTTLTSQSGANALVGVTQTLEAAVTRRIPVKTRYWVR